MQDRLTPGSSVIGIGSIGAERRGGSYGAAKAALGSWNASLSAELAPRGVTCNLISAGFVAGTNFFRGGLTDERRAALVEETQNKRPGTPDDIAQTAHFLASPGARHITGQTIHVNGGAHHPVTPAAARTRRRPRAGRAAAMAAGTAAARRRGRLCTGRNRQVRP